MDTGFKYLKIDENYSFIVYGQQVFVIKKDGDNCTEIHLPLI